MSDEFMKLANKDDEELMVLYQNGLNLAFDEIYSRYASRIYSYFYKKVARMDLSQDLTQETFLKLHRSKNLYNKTLPFTPWLFTISRSVMLDSLKKKNKLTYVSTDHLKNYSEQISPEVGIPSESEIDLKMLRILTPSHQQVVSMKILDDATFEEIALKINTTPENTRQIFSRALKKLRKNFSKKEAL